MGSWLDCLPPTEWEKNPSLLCDDVAGVYSDRPLGVMVVVVVVVAVVNC